MEAIDSPCLQSDELAPIPKMGNDSCGLNLDFPYTSWILYICVCLCTRHPHVKCSSSNCRPGVPQVMADFHSNSELLEGFVVSVYVLGFAFGPLIIAPMSEMWGRLKLYHICSLLFLISTILCAVSKTMGMLIAFRFIAGSFGAAPLALGGGTIADLITRDQRATAMSVWVIGPSMHIEPCIHVAKHELTAIKAVGPMLGPVAGGFITESLGWRWNFWILAIAVSGTPSIMKCC